MNKLFISLIIACLSSALFASECNENGKRNADKIENDGVKKACIREESSAQNEVIALLSERIKFFDTVIERLTALKEQQAEQKLEISSLRKALRVQDKGKKSESAPAPMEIESASPKESLVHQLLKAGKTGSLAAVSSVLKAAPPAAPKASPSIKSLQPVARKSIGGVSPFAKRHKEQLTPSSSPKVPKRPVVQPAKTIEGDESENKLFKCLFSLKNHKGPIAALACDMEGTRIFSVGSLDKMLNIWDARAKLVIKTHRLSIAPLFLKEYTSQTLALGAPQGHLDLLALDTGEIKERRGKEGRGITALALSPDKKFLARGTTRGAKHALSLWQIGAEKKDRYDYFNPIRALSFTEDSKSVIIATGATIIVIRNDTKESVTMQGHLSPVTHLCALGDQCFASAADDGSIFIWDLKDRELKHRIEKAHSQEITALTFNAHENILVSGSKDGIVKCWNIKEGTCYDMIRCSDVKGITALCCNPIKGDIIVGLSEEEIQVWQVCVPKEKAPQPLPRVPDYQDMPDVHQLGVPSEKTLARHSLPEKPAVPTSASTPTLSSAVTKLCISGNPEEIIAGYADGSIKRITPKGQIPLLEGHAGAVLDMYLSPYVLQQLISCSQDGTIRVWDLTTNSCITTLGSDGSVASITSVIPHPNPTFKEILISTSLDKTVKIWDMGSGSCIQTLREITPVSLAIPVISNVHQLITASGTHITLWDLTEGTILHTREAANSNITALLPYCTEETKNGVVVGSADGTIFIVNVDTGFLVGKLQGHKGQINALWSPPGDKRLLVSTSQDGSARVWDMKTSKCIYVSTEANGYHTALLPHPSNPVTMLVGTSRGTIQELLYPVMQKGSK